MFSPMGHACQDCLASCGTMAACMATEVSRTAHRTWACMESRRRDRSLFLARDSQGSRENWHYVQGHALEPADIIHCTVRVITTFLRREREAWKRFDDGDCGVPKISCVLLVSKKRKARKRDQLCPSVSF